MLGRHRWRRPKPKIVIRYRTNQWIRAEKVRLIDENGEPIGIVPIADALTRAREAGLDLVEVSPKADPPVARIVDHGKFQYQQEKREREQKKRAKKVEVKGIRISFRISEHDLSVREEQAKRFLEEGNKVRVEMVLRGREHLHTDRARTIVEDFIKRLGDSVYVDTTITKQGGRLACVIGTR